MANKEVNIEQVAAQQQESLSKAELFLKAYRKTIWTIIAVVVLGSLGALAYSKFVREPKVEEALAEVYKSEESFRSGAWDAALNGDTESIGLAAVIEQYGAKAGKAVYFYAGVCAYNLEDYEAAVKYLTKYSGKDPILAARALACKGDAYVCLEEYADALKAYDQAVKKADNIYAATYLKKAALVHEKLGQDAQALECYKAIKDQYPASFEAYDIDKYISRIENK